MSTDAAVVARHPAGTLFFSGVLKLGRLMLAYYKCGGCGMSYPKLDDVITCNGDAIDACPWCRPDSKPWRNGRGI